MVENGSVGEKASSFETRPVTNAAENEVPFFVIYVLQVLAVYISAPGAKKSTSEP